MPFMGLAEMAQSSPAFIPQGPQVPLGLAMQPMPMQPEGGILQSLGVMPMFPGVIPIMDPLFAGVARVTSVTPPPTIICYPPACPNAPRSPARVLMMCGGVLYFIPSGIFVPLPVCAISLDTSDTSETGDPGNLPHSPPKSVSQAGTDRPGYGGQPGSFEVIPSATSHPFRQPGNFLLLSRTTRTMPFGGCESL